MDLTIVFLKYKYPEYFRLPSYCSEPYSSILITQRPSVINRLLSETGAGILGSNTED